MAALFTAIIGASWPVLATFALASLYSSARELARKKGH